MYMRLTWVRTSSIGRITFAASWMSWLQLLSLRLRDAQLTLWGGMAENPGQQLEAAVAGGNHPVLAVKVPLPEPLVEPATLFKSVL